MTTDERLVRATLAWMRTVHGDEDMHPAALDPAEAELERALGEHKWEKRGASHMAARPRA